MIQSIRIRSITSSVVTFTSRPLVASRCRCDAFLEPPYDTNLCCSLAQQDYSSTLSVDDVSFLISFTLEYIVRMFCFGSRINNKRSIFQFFRNENESGICPNSCRIYRYYSVYKYECSYEQLGMSTLTSYQVSYCCTYFYFLLPKK